MLADPPLHPSYEDRPGAPDRVFAALDDDACRAPRRGVGARAGGARARPTPTCCTCTTSRRSTRPRARVAPGVPVVGHLHGTELLMLEAIEARARGAGRTAAAWAERMRALGGALRAADRALRRRQVERAERLLGVDPERCVRVPNGFDPERSGRATSTAALWRRSWSTSRAAGRPARRPAASATPGDWPFATTARCCSTSAASPRSSAAAADRGLRRAPARASPAARRSCSSAASRASGRASTRSRRSRRTGAAGRLPGRLARARRAARTSSPPPTSSCCRRVREQFGQVLVEGMACGLPAIAVDALRAGGDRRRTARRAGWSSPTTSRGLAERAGRGRQPARRSAAGAARRGRARRRASATPGRRSPSGWPRVYDATSLRPPQR